MATPENFKNFAVAEGVRTVRYLPITASVAMEQGTCIAASGSGVYQKAAVTDKDLYIIDETIATTDADYATAGKMKRAYQCTQTTDLYFTVGAGTFTTADIGNAVQLHTDSKSLAVDTTTNPQFVITNLLSSTRGICRPTGRQN